MSNKSMVFTIILVIVALFALNSIGLINITPDKDVGIIIEVTNENYAETILNEMIETCGYQPHSGFAWGSAVIGEFTGVDVGNDEIETNEDQWDCMLYELGGMDTVDDCWILVSEDETKTVQNEKVVICYERFIYDMELAQIDAMKIIEG